MGSLCESYPSCGTRVTYTIISSSSSSYSFAHPINSDMMSAYYRRLTSPDADVRLKAAKIWTGNHMTIHMYIYI
jgi:hypothetical protein